MNNFSRELAKFLLALALLGLELGHVHAVAAKPPQIAMSASEIASINKLRALKKAENFKEIAIALKAIKPNGHSLNYCLEVPRAVTSSAHNIQAIVDFLTMAIAIYPQSDQLYLTRADTWLEVDESELAGPDIRRAIELNPRSWKAHSELGEFLRNQQKYKEALTEVEKAIACGGPKDKLYDQKAELHIQMFQLKQAEQAFREAIKNSKPSETWLSRQHLARMLSSSKRFNEALAEYKSLAGVNPSPELKVDIATCLVGLGKYKEALNFLTGDFPEEFNLSSHRLKKQCFVALKDSARAKQEDQIIAKLSADF